MKFEDLHRLGTEQAVKDAGLLHIEGKEYVMEDGDIVISGSTSEATPQPPKTWLRFTVACRTLSQQSHLTPLPAGRPL